MNSGSEVRSEESGKKRPGIDGKVKDGKELLQLKVLLRSDKLVASESRNARLDAARSHADDEKAKYGYLSNRY